MFGRFRNNRKPKSGSESKFFTAKKQPRLPEDKPDTRETTIESAKDDVAAKDKKKEAEQKSKDEQEEQTRQIIEETGNKKTPNFERTAETKEPKGEEPKTAPSANVGIKGPFASIWEFEETDLFTDKIYGKHSYYTPNALSMWESLIASHWVLSDNEHLRWVNKNYMSFPVTLYYCIMYYIRILQVRQTQSENTDNESKFLRTFNRKYKFNSLPIVGFLVPFFSSIAAYDPADDRLKWLLPSFSCLFRGADGADYVNDYRLDPGSVNALCQPNILVLYTWWKAFCTQDDLVARYKYKETFVPRYQDGDVRLGDTEIHVAAMTAPELQHLASLGIDRRHPESFEKYIETADFWRDSSFASKGPGMNHAGRNAIDNIASFLCMHRDLGWFDDCIAMAMIHMKYFAHPTFFSEIDPIGGCEVGISGDVNYNTPAADKRFIIAGGVTWFNNILRNPTGDLRWYEQCVKDYHKLNFRHTMTNCTVRVRYSVGNGNNADVDADHDLQGLQDQNAGTRTARWGPWYYVDHMANRMAHHVTTYWGGSTASFDVFDRRKVLIQERFYKGKASDE